MRKELPAQLRLPFVTCLLFLGLVACGGETAPVPAVIRVRPADSPSPTLDYAVDRLVAELRSVHGLQASADRAAGDPLKPAVGDTGLVVLGRPSQSAALARWSRDHGFDPTTLASQPEAYHIFSQAKPCRVVIVAHTELGVWYGACAWLDSLRDSADGAPFMPVGEVHDAPALAIRFSRGLGGNEHLSQADEAIPTLDWWARWRMNVAHVGGLPEPALKTFLAEAHKRGIRVVRGLGVRNLCAADDRAVAKCAGEFRRFLELGGDGASALWDDLPHARCAGHCDRCRERFGANSLPREIVHVLESLGDVAAQAPGHPLILWCPPHYSENRYRELTDEAFFHAVGASQKVRRQTQMYYCEFAPEKTLLLDQAGITNRVWWYNGLRTVYHVSHNWPSAPEMKLSIPGVKSFDAPDFARFDVGWKTGIGVRGDATMIPASEKVWRELRTLPERYQGYYPCTAGHPYHAAMSGRFALSPREFDQDEADRVVFRAIFGPGSAKAARAWSDAYVGVQIWLAQTAGSPITETRMAEARQRLAQWRACSREVQRYAAAGRGLLAPAIAKATLARMEVAEESVARILAHLNRPSQVNAESAGVAPAKPGKGR